MWGSLCRGRKGWRLPAAETLRVGMGVNRQEGNGGKMDGDSTRIERHIDVLDGVRAVAVGLVAWFHFWQQSWITPKITFPTNITKYFGLTGINLEGFVRYGFVFVDMLILISAFCNFYPYARSILLQEPWPDTMDFYRKRAIRILPSYYFFLLMSVAIMIAEGTFVADGFFWKDLLTHLTCTGPLFPDTHLGSRFSFALWTVQIEVLYYLLMPWIARLFRRWPVLTTIGLWGGGIVSANYILYEKGDMIRAYGNQMATFAGCYANGMLLCLLYITLRRSLTENRYTRLAATGAAFCCVLHLSRMMRQLGAGELELVQLGQRFELSLVFSVFLLSLPLACRGLKVLFSNGAMRLLAGISYNFYMWHQYIAVKCKEWRIPYWEGETPPNMTGDRVWMWKYQILIVLFSLAVAFVLTYGLERPVSIAMKKHAGKNNTRL